LHECACVPPRARQMNVATRCQASGREYSQWAIPESNSARRSSTKHPEAWISRFGCIAPGAAGWYTSAAFRAVPTARQGAFCAPRPQTMAGASRSGLVRSQRPREEERFAALRSDVHRGP
jgi:hypothetical protein